MRGVALILLVLLACCADAKHAGPANAGAQEVFREMMMSYGAMPSYDQSGVVRMVAKGEAKKDVVSETRFHIGFSRPDALELQYGDHVSLSARGHAVTDGDGTSYPSVDEAIRALGQVDARSLAPCPVDAARARELPVAGGALDHRALDASRGGLERALRRPDGGPRRRR